MFENETTQAGQTQRESEFVGNLRHDDWQTHIMCSTLDEIRAELLTETNPMHRTDLIMAMDCRHGFNF